MIFLANLNKKIRVNRLDVIKVGIVGLGKIGKIRLNELKNNKNTVVVAVCDLKRPIDLDKNIKFCETFEILLNQNIDAVFICTFNNVLAIYTLLALKKNKHVFCEKPPAITSKDLKLVIEAENNSNSILKYGFNHRYHSSIVEAKKVIESGVMGNMIWIKSTYGKNGRELSKNDWRNNFNDSGGGILMDQGIHMVDLINHLTEEIFVDIHSYITSSNSNNTIEDNAFIILKSKNNLPAMIHSSSSMWEYKFLIEICFDNGYLNIDGILSSTNNYAPEKLIVGTKHNNSISEETITYTTDNSWKIEIDEFIDSINSKSKVVNGTSEDSLKVISMIEKIYIQSGFYND